MMSKETEYAPLDGHEGFEDVDLKSTPRPRRRLSTLRLIAYIEAVHLALFLFGYFLWVVIIKTTSPSNLGMPLAYNVTTTFNVDKEKLTWVANTPEAEKYWYNITMFTNNGLVSLPLSWAEKKRLKLSGLKTEPGQSVFQIDLFHQLHCLQRIRADLRNMPSMIIMNPNMTVHEPHIKHTQHCIDYLRQTLICHGDMTIVSTGKDLEFDHSPARQCRDFDAISDWVMANKWDYDKFDGGTEKENDTGKGPAPLLLTSDAPETSIDRV